MKRQKFDYENLDLSRWHILDYHEQLLVNGGTTGGSDNTESTSQTESAEDTTETEASSVAEESNSASETTTETGTSGTAGGSAPAATEEETPTGGHEIENTIEAVANAEPGDTLTRDDGTQVTITQGDINWAQEHCDNDGKDEENKDSQTAKGDENATTKDTDALSDSQSGGNSEQSSGSKEDELGEEKTSVGSNKTDADNEKSGTQKEDAVSKENGSMEKSSAESKSGVSKVNETLPHEGSKPNNSGSNHKCEEFVGTTGKSKNENTFLFDTGTVIKPTEPPVEKIDSVYNSPFGNQPNTYISGNQTKSEKEVYAEAVFTDKPGEFSCNMGAGLLSASSEFNINSPVHAQGQVDLANANFNFGVTEGGAHCGFGLNGISVSGNIGVDTNPISVSYGGSIGFDMSFGIGLDISNGFHLTLDAAFIIGGSLDVRIGGNRD